MFLYNWYNPDPIALLFTYGYVVLGFAFFYLTGFVAFRIIGINEQIGVFPAHFFRLYAGLHLVVAIFAINTAGTKTLQIFVPLLLAITWLFRKPLSFNSLSFTGSSKPEVPARYFLVFMGLGSAIYFLWWWVNLTNAGASLNLPFWDHIFYSRISTIMEIRHFEAKKISALFEPDYHNVAPYHYTELWITALFSKNSGLPHLISNELLTYTVLQTLIALAVLSIAERFTKITPWILIFSLLSVFYFGIALHWYSYLGKLPAFVNHPEFLNSNLYPKQLIIYLNFGLFLVLFLYNYRLLGFVALLLTGILYSVLIPAIFGGICAYVCWQAVFYKQYRYLWLLLVAGIFAACLFIFYGVINKSQEVNTLSKYLLLYPNPLIHLKGFTLTAVNIGVLFIDLILAVSISMGLTGWKKLGRQVNNFLPMAFIMLAGYAISAITFGFVDWDQFYQLVWSPILFFCATGCWLWVFMHLGKQKTNTGFNVAKALFFVICAVNVYFIHNIISASSIKINKPFSDRVAQVLRENKANPLGAFIDVPNNTAQVTELRYLGTELLYYNPNFIVAGLTVFDDLKAGLGANSNLLDFAKADVFYRFTEQQKKRKQFKNIHQSQLDFICQKKIDYLFVNGKINLGEFPEILAATTLQLTDTLRNNRFLLINRAKLGCVSQ
jgi:hypothetical protein